MNESVASRVLKHREAFVSERNDEPLFVIMAPTTYLRLEEECRAYADIAGDQRVIGIFGLKIVVGPVTEMLVVGEAHEESLRRL